MCALSRWFAVNSECLCTGILKNLVDQWTDTDQGVPGFDEYTRKHIVPVCILAPTKPTFDWRDGQTVLVCNIGYSIDC